MAKNILVIDDEEIFLDLLKNYLETKGFQVTIASSGQKILKMLFEKSYDLVLLDVWMVDMSGVEVCKKIKKANPDLPVILMTGYASTSLVNTMKDIEVDAFVQKPFKLSDVYNKITSLLDKKGGQPPETPEIPTVEKGKYKILVADDDRQYLKTLGEMFQSNGFSTLLANNGREALEVFKQNRDVNILVLDVKMPEIDGIKLLKEIRAISPKVGAIFITALDDKELHKKLVNEKGAYAVFQKPFSYRHFLRFIEMTEQLKQAKN